MSRVGVINRQYKINEIAQKYKLSKTINKKIINSSSTNSRQKYNAFITLSKIARKGSETRLRNRCFITGRSRGYYRFFGVSRIMIKLMASSGLMPGMVKSSW